MVPVFVGGQGDILKVFPGRGFNKTKQKTTVLFHWNFGGSHYRRYGETDDRASKLKNICQQSQDLRWRSEKTHEWWQNHKKRHVFSEKKPGRLDCRTQRGNLILNPLDFRKFLGKLGNFNRTCYNVVEALSVLAVSKHLGIPNVCETNMLIELYIYFQQKLDYQIAHLKMAQKMTWLAWSVSCSISFKILLINTPRNPVKCPSVSSSH